MFVVPIATLVVVVAVVLLMVLFVVVFGSKKSGDTADDIVIPNVGASDFNCSICSAVNEPVPVAGML